MSRWDVVKEKIDRAEEESGVFVRLKDDGDKFVGVFLGEPLARDLHWTGESYEECQGEDCPFCKKGKPSLRVAMNVARKTDHGWQLGVIEQTASFFKDVMKCDGKYGLDKWCFEVERHGAAGNPKTSYSILPETELNKQDKKDIAGLELYDLREFFDAGSDTAKEDSSAAKDVPVPDKVANAVIAVLKELPKDATAQFLEKFGIKKVRELRESDRESAIAFLEKLRAGHVGAATETEDDDDPLA